MSGPEHDRKGTTYGDCPSCGYKNALATTRKNGRTLYHCHAGCDQNNLWKIVRDQEPRVPSLVAPQPRTEGNALVRNLWETSLHARGTIVEAYLRGRGITGAIPPSLRWLPNQLHKPTQTRWNVMLSAVVDSGGELKALHRTYLDSNRFGKAPVEPAKMTLGSIRGYACHLGAAGDELAISEGIETGLSFQLASSIPTWAALNTGGMRTLYLPPMPLASFVTIAADADEPGVRAAEDAAARWRSEGRHVRIVMPPRAGLDFNDMLLKANL